jgi:putative oxidoreductase
MKYLTILGRFLFSALFIFAGTGHFSAATIGYAASQGVPLASIAVPLSGIMAILGGLSILLGYKAKLGALLLIAFLVPVTLMMHAFWSVSDPMQQQMQMIMFMKNLALTGTAILIFVRGSGPGSLDARN